VYGCTPEYYIFINLVILTIPYVSKFAFKKTISIATAYLLPSQYTIDYNSPIIGFDILVIYN